MAEETLKVGEVYAISGRKYRAIGTIPKDPEGRWALKAEFVRNNKLVIDYRQMTPAEVLAIRAQGNARMSTLRMFAKLGRAHSVSQKTARAF